MEMKMKKSLILLSVAIAMTGMVGCKPTETNYQAASDVAKKKRQASDALDAELGIPSGGLINTDGPMLHVVHGDSVYVKVDRVRMLESSSGKLQQYNVAVGSYKMNTNCVAQVEDLCSKGYSAFGVMNADRVYYVIAGSFPTLEEAAAFDTLFQRKERGQVYPGLNGKPVIIMRP